MGMETEMKRNGIRESTPRDRFSRLEPEVRESSPIPAEGFGVCGQSGRLMGIRQCVSSWTVLQMDSISFSTLGKPRI